MLIFSIYYGSAMSSEPTNEAWFRAWYDTREEADARKNRHDSSRASAQASFEASLPTPENSENSHHSDFDFGDE